MRLVLEYRLLVEAKDFNKNDITETQSKEIYRKLKENQLIDSNGYPQSTARFFASDDVYQLITKDPKE